MIKRVDELPLGGIHHLEFWVGNAKQAEYFYRNAFGFERIAYAGPETGVRDRASYVLAQGKIRFELPPVAACCHSHSVGRRICWSAEIAPSSRRR